MRKLIAVLLIVAFSVGCMTVTVDAPMVKAPVSLSSQTGNVGATTTRHFIRKGRAFFALWGLVPISTPNTNNWIQEELQMGEGVAVKNMKVRTYFDVVDFLVNLVLGYFTVVSKTVEIEGDVVK